MKTRIHILPKTLKDAYLLLDDSHPLLLASSTAFFATFSLSPIIILLVNFMGLCLKSEKVSAELFVSIQTTFGTQAAKQIETIVHNFKIEESNGWIAVAGFVFLIFVSTTLLRVIQQSIHILWRITHKPINRFKFGFIERAKAFAMILSIGLLFLVSLLMDGSIALMRDYTGGFMPSATLIGIRAINIMLSVSLITAWLTILFKFLPDTRVKWRVAFAGGLVTGTLFNIGKVILANFLLYSRIASLYGASAAFALILLFIFYTAFIFYFGAAFTFAYGKNTKRPIKPSRHSSQYFEKVIVEEKITATIPVSK